MNYFENKTIVVPVDFSDDATRAVKRTMEFCGPSSELHLVHVVDPVPTMISFDPSMPIPPSYDKERVDHAEEHLKKLFGNGEYSRFKRHCVVGDPGTEIVDLAKRVQADLIVMPSHGRTGLKRLFLGSVAERVLRLSECPVLILREKS